MGNSNWPKLLIVMLSIATILLPSTTDGTTQQRKLDDTSIYCGSCYSCSPCILSSPPPPSPSPPKKPPTPPWYELPPSPDDAFFTLNFRPGSARKSVSDRYFLFRVLSEKGGKLGHGDIVWVSGCHDDILVVFKGKGISGEFYEKLDFWDLQEQDGFYIFSVKYWGYGVMECYYSK